MPHDGALVGYDVQVVLRASLRAELNGGVADDTDKEFTEYLRFGGFTLIFMETNETSRETMLDSFFLIPLCCGMSFVALESSGLITLSMFWTMWFPRQGVTSQDGIFTNVCLPMVP